MLILENGLNYKILSKKSMAFGDDPGYLLDKMQRFLFSKVAKYCRIFLSCMKILSLSSGVPITSNIAERLS
jgi:hypothetical protein